MVNNDNENNVDYEEITDEQTDTTEPELTDIEAAEVGKLKKLRDQLKLAEEDKKTALEELANVRADYLNARKRLEEDTKRTVERKTIKHMEALLPLADSFHMAMSNKDVWEKADENWRKGVEGINSQLLQILKDNGVHPVNPIGETFDPTKHEAIGTEEVDTKDVDTVMAVVQQGYEMTIDGKTETIRPARVITGVTEKQT